MSVDWLEVVFGDIAADLAPEVRALQTGVPEVKAGQGARQFDVPDGVAKAPYSRVVWVTRLSREKGTLSVPKNAASAVATAEL